ncbi:hypothetical protein [Devosia sp.]|uniref:hypothetical protein n=1 Tax=Devosia sp. TaxID=1871048 RepID=UPI0019FD84C9|nr:hypothetical protein [Devosia sp.]MBE0578451.1 hypothetical protein [Devosia sp.]
MQIVICSSNPDYYLEVTRQKFEEAGLQTYEIIDGRQPRLIDASKTTTYYYVGARFELEGAPCVSQYPTLVDGVTADFPSLPSWVFGKAMQPMQHPYSMTHSDPRNGWMVSYCYVSDDVCGDLIIDSLVDLILSKAL